MYNKQEYLLKGKEVELKLMQQLKNCVAASVDEDIHQHIDLKQIISIDVKGLKKIFRDDEKYNEQYHWIEFKNVNGKQGWLYGDSDFIAFETEDYWFIVERLALISFISIKLKNKQVHLMPKLYEYYRRQSRQNELLTLVKTIDLAYLATKIILKDD